MKKKIIEFLLMICMVIMSVMPVMAEGEGKVSDDAKVQEAYEAYLKVVDAMNNHEYAIMKENYNKVDELTLGFEDEQAEEWQKVLKENGGELEALENLFEAAYIIGLDSYRETYNNTPNAKSAYDFVTNYDECVASEISFKEMLEDIEEDYAKALNDLPSEDVVTVYKAYEKIQTAMSFGYDEDFVKACEEFEAVLDVFNALSEEDLNVLALFLHLENGEEAFNQIFFDWINANTILELGAVYDAYVADPNADTAKALVEKYDEVFGNTELFTPDDFVLFQNAVFCIEDYYEEAKALLAEASDSGEPGIVEPEEDEADRNASPKTGDDSDMMMTFAVMVGAAALVFATVKKKVIN